MRIGKTYHYKDTAESPTLTSNSVIHTPTDVDLIVFGNVHVCCSAIQFIYSTTQPLLSDKYGYSFECFLLSELVSVEFVMDGCPSLSILHHS